MRGAAASAALLAACGGETTGVAGTLSTREVVSSDSAQTVFLQFRFTASSIVSVCDSCTASVTVTPAPGAFGFTVGPAGLVWAPVLGSGPGGTDRVEGPVVAAGPYLLAAPK
jgi:hypothetical protein